MADYGVAVTWGDAKAGREKKALELWADAVTMNEKAVADGRIDSWDAVLFEPSATPPAGATRLYGSQDQIEEHIRSDEFQNVMQRATMLLNNVGFRRFVSGDALVQAFGQFSQVVETL
jgi:hypothetical protein